MGDIGKTVKRIELEPLEVPQVEPVTAPEREVVPA